MIDKQKIQEAIALLQDANNCQQAANLPVSDIEEDVTYEIHNAIENIIDTLEEYLD